MIVEKAPPSRKPKRPFYSNNMDTTIMTFLTIVPQAVAPIVLEQNSCFPQELEIDGVADKEFGTLYRVWLDYRLIGSFYQNLEGKWIAQPVSGVVNGGLSTDIQAILIILFVTGNLTGTYV